MLSSIPLDFKFWFYNCDWEQKFVWQKWKYDVRKKFFLLALIDKETSCIAWNIHMRWFIIFFISNIFILSSTSRLIPLRMSPSIDHIINLSHRRRTLKMTPFFLYDSDDRWIELKNHKTTFFLYWHLMNQNWGKDVCRENDDGCVQQLSNFLFLSLSF